MIEFSSLVTLTRLTLTLALLGLIKFIYNRFKIVQHFSKFPHLKGHWLLGNLVETKTSLFKSEELAEQQRKSNDRF